MKKSEENYYREGVGFDSISPFVTKENLDLLETEVSENENISFLEPFVLQLLSTLVGKKIKKLEEKLEKTDLECLVFLIFQKLDVVVPSYFSSLLSCYCVFHDLKLVNYEYLICQLIHRFEVENNQEGNREVMRMFIESFEKFEKGSFDTGQESEESEGEKDENSLQDEKPVVLKNRFCSAVLKKIMENKWYKDLIEFNITLDEKSSKLLPKYVSEDGVTFSPGKFEEEIDPIWTVEKLEDALFRQTGVTKDLDSTYLKNNSNHSFSFDGSVFVQCHLEILMLVSNSIRQLVEDVKEYLCVTNKLIITGIETYEGLLAFLEFCFTSRVSVVELNNLSTMNLLKFCEENNEERFLKYLFDQICPRVFSREEEILERQIEEIIGRGYFLSGESTVKIRNIWMRKIRDENRMVGFIEKCYEKRMNELILKSRELQRKVDSLEIENEDFSRNIKNLKKKSESELKMVWISKFFRLCKILLYSSSILIILFILLWKQLG